MNTFFSLCGSCVGAMVISLINHKGKFSMEDVLNATLAGGVIIGASSDLILSPAISIVVGCLGGVVSALGFHFLSPFLNDKINLHDSCGVQNLHGTPGLLGGLVGAIVIMFVNKKKYEDNIGDILVGGRSNEK